MEPKTRHSGFASMEQDKQRQIARKGGMAAHEKGTAHEFSAEEARNAGRKGGQSVSLNRAHMIEIGRLGGKRSAARRRANSVAASAGGQSGRHSGEAYQPSNAGEDRTDPEIPGADMGDDLGDDVRDVRVIPPDQSHQAGAQGQNAAL